MNYLGIVRIRLYVYCVHFDWLRDVCCVQYPHVWS